MGELEHLVLLTVLSLEGDASALRVREELGRESGRSITRGALYRSLDRLAEKGMLEWDVVAPSEERGGHTRRFYRVSERGRAAVRERRETLERLWARASAALGA